MTSLWHGDSGHIDFTHNGVHMCAQVTGVMISNEAIRNELD